MEFFGAVPNDPAVPFVAVQPAELVNVLDDPRTLVVDIRPHGAHADSRLPRALSLSVPSTLLKRPLFSLDRLAQMLSSPAARQRFAAFRDSARILIYDADSFAIPPSSNINGLLRKFRAAHFTGQLSWLRGGFQAVSREQPHLVDSAPLDDDDPDDAPILCTRRLPMAAFASPSTSPGPINPFFDVVRQNIELSHGIIERIPLRLPNRVRRRIPDLPFSWLRQIANRADRMPTIRHPLSDSSDSEPAPLSAVVDQGSQSLATQFYRIEVAEQNRLMAVMDHHSKQTAQVSFPFSITAGIEKGSKNRYKHIWPFEHARVKLCQTGREDMDDYVNASFVQPLGTTKKYIATQGPLEATFEDFWRLIWQQNVHVIVMLTREVENSMVKCGTYWPDAPTRERTFGMLHVTLMAKTGLPANVDLVHDDTPSTNGRAKKRRRVTTIKRTFKLEHWGYPNAGWRQVVQLQYLEWPDMNVPEDARGVLGLVEDVEKAVRETGEICESPPGERRGDECGQVDPLTGVAWHVMGGRRPVLLHCSAGVGRTGCFIAMDAVLDAIRREVGQDRDGAEMDVDGKEGLEVLVPSAMDDDGTRQSAVNNSLVSSCTVPSPNTHPSTESVNLSSSQSFPPNTTCVSGKEAQGRDECSYFTADNHNGSVKGGRSNSQRDLASVSGTPLDTCRHADLVVPRALHELPKTPVALSTFEDPILEVVQDMREQRMSLCQSLRQYVFMHQAVIEGALRIVDEERERQRRKSMLGESNEKAVDDIELVAASVSFGNGGTGMSRSKTFPVQGPRPQSASSRNLVQPPPALSLDLSDISKYSSSSSGSGLNSDTGSSTMKRGASPTELLKQGKKGELLLSKRPSVKRKMKESIKDVQRGGAAVPLD